MSPDDRLTQFNVKFSQSPILNETTVDFEIASTNNQQTKNDKLLNQEEIAQSMMTLRIYKPKLLDFCGLWEDYPNHRYRMEFSIEMGELVGYSNAYDGKAYASYDGKLIDMIIIYPKETNRPFDRYRGRLGWNQTYIVWEKQDSLCERGWRLTRRWIKLK